MDRILHKYIKKHRVHEVHCFFQKKSILHSFDTEMLSHSNLQPRDLLHFQLTNNPGPGLTMSKRTKESLVSADSFKHRYYANGFVPPI